MDYKLTITTVVGGKKKSWKNHNVDNYGYRKEVNDTKQINVHDQLSAFRRCSIEDMFRLEVRS